jgi:hypothetical protein
MTETYIGGDESPEKGHQNEAGLGSWGRLPVRGSACSDFRHRGEGEKILLTIRA